MASRPAALRSRPPNQEAASTMTSAVDTPPAKSAMASPWCSRCHQCRRDRVHHTAPRAIPLYLHARRPGSPGRGHRTYARWTHSAESSIALRQQQRLAIDMRTSANNRMVLTWHPIFEVTDREVWQEIATHGLECHPDYDALIPRHVDRTTGNDTPVSWTTRSAASVGSHTQPRMEGSAWRCRAMWSAMSTRSGFRGGAGGGDQRCRAALENGIAPAGYVRTSSSG